jgi:hypothetical protein
LSDRPIAFAHSLNAGPRRDGIARADIAVHHLRELFADFIGKLGYVRKVVERPITGGQGHVEPSEIRSRNMPLR